MNKLSLLCLFLLLLGVGFIEADAQSYSVDTLSIWKGIGIHKGDEVSLLVFNPDKPNGLSSVVCPGGSYFWLDKEGEGVEVGQWLCRNGITAFVLYYRTAGVPDYVWHARAVFHGKRHPDMITDAQRALQIAWEKSDKYGIDPNKIGIMGFSAGGHLAMSTVCLGDHNFLETIGINTEAKLKPAYIAAIYPVVTMKKPYVHKRSRRGLLGDSRQHNKKMIDSLSLEMHIPDDCPPVFLINCKDDPVVDYRNSVLLDSALTAKKIDHIYYQYPTGKHGFGVSDYYGSPESRSWRDSFLSWLSNHF